MDEGSPLTGWLSTAWGAATAWIVLLGFVGLLLRGRAFGPRLELPGGAHAVLVAAHGDRLALLRLFGHVEPFGRTCGRLRTRPRSTLPDPVKF